MAVVVALVDLVTVAEADSAVVVRYDDAVMG